MLHYFKCFRKLGFIFKTVVLPSETVASKKWPMGIVRENCEQ